jgi:hypothetical protein
MKDIEHGAINIILLLGLQFLIANNLSVTEWALVVVGVCGGYLNGVIRGCRS